MSGQPRRINVAITPATADALRHLVEREGVTISEAVRRLVGYGDHIYRHVKVDGGRVLLLNRDSETTQEVTLL